MARGYHKQDQKAHTLKYYRKLVQNLETKVSKAELVRAYIELASIYKEWNLPKKALENYLMANNILEPDEEPELKIKALKNAAQLYRQIESYQNALTLYGELVDIYKSRGEELAFTNTLKPITSVQKETGEPQDAIHTPFLLLSTYQKRQDSLGVLWSYSQIGQLNFDNNNYTRSIEYYLKYFQLANLHIPDLKTDSEHPIYIRNLLNTGMMYEQLSDQDYLENYRNEAEAVATGSGQK
jgi:tetratricopeptide (TPR) repeat protein